MKTYIIIAAALLLTAGGHAQPLALSLEECREMALAHSEELKKSSNNVRQAELDHRMARQSLLPRLSGSATGMYMAPDMDFEGMTLSLKGTWNAGLNLTQPLYAGGKIISGMKLARLGREASQEERRATRATVIADADNAYWTYIAVREKRRMLLSMLDYIRSIYTRVKHSVEVDMATSADLLRVEAKRSDLGYQLEKVDNGLEMCRMNLCHVIGADLATQITPADTAISVDGQSVRAVGRELIEHRPEYRLLQKQADISREQIRQVRADYLPSLAFTAGYSYFGNLKLEGSTDDGSGNRTPFSERYNDDSFTLMLSLSVPIWNWGEGHKKVKRQRLAAENARLDLEKNRRLMSIELKNAYNNLRSSETLIATAEAGERDATEALRVVTDRYEVGLCTLTDLLEAQSQWHSARSNVIEAKTQYKIDETAYLRAAGLLE